MKKVGLVIVVAVLFVASFSFMRHRAMTHREPPDMSKAAAIAQRNVEKNLASAGVIEEKPENRPAAIAQREAFEAIHAPEVAIAKDIYRASPERPDVDKLYEMIKSDVETTVARDQSDMAANLHVSQKEACEFLLNNTDAVLAEVNLRKLQPAVYAALHAAAR